MQLNEVFKFLDSEAEFVPTLAVQQSWKKGSFSYLDTPRPDHGLLLLTEGQIEFRAEDSVLLAHPGDVIFLPKNSRYCSIFPKEPGAARDYLVNFNASVDRLPVCSPVRIHRDAFLGLETQFRLLVESFFLSGGSSLRKRGQLYLLLDAVIRLRADGLSAEQRKTVQKAQELLQSEEALSVADIARYCCISERSLRRLFTEAVGIPPAKYRLRMKLGKAKLLLESSELSVSEIADALRFFDAAYFCKLFTEHEGMTPSAYRRNKRL